MKRIKKYFCLVFLTAFLLGQPVIAFALQPKDPLPSWNQGPTKQAIVEFVSKVTDKNNPEYVSVDNRIAVFDNDGTLWAEKPYYFQLAFVFDRIKSLFKKNPQWKKQKLFSIVWQDDKKELAKLNHEQILELVAKSHSGITTENFISEVKAWLKKAKHPQKDKPYTKLIYQPMLELLDYLKNNGFKNYIVSGGGVDFIRAFAEEVYGIPPERVIGSSLKTSWKIENKKPVIVKLPKINSINDKEGKPLNINLHIGKVPIIAVGNSDGDLAMLEWTAAGAKPQLMVLLHHDDAEREYAYDRKSSVGRLDKALDKARSQRWILISMKKDFAKVFPR